GSVQHIESIPSELKRIYRTAWELPMRALIDMAAERGAFVDQSQSLNLFLENPSIEQLSSMYFYAWKKGLKTTYYLRSRPATRIAKTTIDEAHQQGPTSPEWTPSAPPAEPKLERAACSLENPESCEACQ